MQQQPILSQCLLLVMFTLGLLWTVPATATHHEPSEVSGKNVYICGCGTAAKCNMVSDQPGKAPCGMPLLERQVLREEVDRLYVCACSDNCKCSLNQADPAKCACGKELRAYPKVGSSGCPKAMMGDGDKRCDSCPKQAPCGDCPKKPAAPM